MGVKSWLPTGPSLIPLWRVVVVLLESQERQSQGEVQAPHSASVGMGRGKATLLNVMFGLSRAAII